MTYDSLPPLTSDSTPQRARFLRWAWIPLVFVIPAAVWGAAKSLESEKQDPPTETLDRLAELANQQAAQTKPAAQTPQTQAPNPDEQARTDLEKLDDDSIDDADDSADDLTEMDDAVDDDVAQGIDDSQEEDGVTEGAFWVQVASLPLKERADNLASALRNNGHDAKSQAYGGPRAGWWHVVRLGPYSTRIEAENARLAFYRAERMNAVVLPRARGSHQIQVASLRSESSATHLAKQLLRQGHAASVRTLNMGKSGIWHTVRVGPFESQDDAQAYQALLEASGQPRGELIPRPTVPPSK